MDPGTREPQQQACPIVSASAGGVNAAFRTAADATVPGSTGLPVMAPKPKPNRVCRLHLSDPAKTSIAQDSEQ